MSIKLSETQHAAVVEVSDLGYTVAKANTIKSLETKGLIDAVGVTHHRLTDLGREYLGLPAKEEVSKEESLESVLKGDPWKMGEAITEDEALIVLDPERRDNFTEVLGWEPDSRGVVDVTSMVQSSTEFDKFDDKWDDQFKITAGFGATLEWKGSEVWNGLTAAEIKEDMETATPINRKARRTHFRTLRNAFRRVTVQRPRKALKVTGKVGV